MDRNGCGCSKAAWLAVLALAVGLFAGCGREVGYDQTTPDDVINSAVEMVRNGDADRLPQLLYADSPEMRAVLDRLGLLLGKMQRLAGAVQEEMPEEIARIRAEGEGLLADGQLNSLMPRGEDPGEAFRGVLGTIFADPYGFIEQNEGRLSTLKLADDLATVTLDDQPLFGGVLVLREVDGIWYLVLPTELPGVNTVMPRNREMWQIVASFITVFEKMVNDVTARVEAGRIRSVEELGDEALETVMFPAAIAGAAYSNEVEVWRRYDRMMRDYRSRERSWLKERRDLARTREEPEPSDQFLKALRAVVSDEVQARARKRSRFRFEELSDARFEAVLAEWLEARGLRLNLDDALGGPAVQSRIDAWSLGKGAALMGLGDKADAKPGG